MAKNCRSHEACYTNSATIVGDSEGSGRSAQVDMGLTASQDSSNPMRKCISLNSTKQDTFGVPTQVLSVSGISPSQRKGVVLRLRAELEQIQILQMKLESQRTNHATLSSSSDILSCSNVRNGALIESGKSSVMSSSPGKILDSESHKERGWNMSTSGRFESGYEAPKPSSACLTLLRQCEALLKRLMSHQFGWVFNTPVDVVKLNLPDYFSVITHPMDLGTIKSKLASAVYSNPLEFLADVRLTFSNAMTYNPPGNDFHFMAKSMSKFFEARWKSVEKKIPVTGAQIVRQSPVPREENETTAKRMPSSKRRKIISLQHLVVSEPVVERIMADEEKHFLRRKLESLLEEMPARIIDFLRKHSSSGKETEEDEIEIDIDDFSDDTLFTLHGLLDECLQEKQKTLVNPHHCEIELLNESRLSNSSMPPCKENDIVGKDIDIGGNEPPVSSHPLANTDKDSDNGSRNEAGVLKASISVNVSKVPPHIQMKAHPDAKIRVGDQIETKELVSGLDQVEVQLQQMPNSMESDCCQDVDNAPTWPVSPGKLYRAALLKNRFADTILKAREKTLKQGENGDPEKLRREKEQLEIQRKKEKARLQAEAKAAENARRRAEVEAAVEAKRKRDLEREAARQALLKIEKTVEINENFRLLKDLEMLGSAPGNYPICNPLEQLGLFMKDDEDEEEGEQPNAPNSLEQFGLYMMDGNDKGEQNEQPSIPNPLEQYGLYMKEYDGDKEEEGEQPNIGNSLEQSEMFSKSDNDEEDEGEVPNLPNSLKQPGVRDTLEQLGLYLKKDDEDKEVKPSTVPISPVPFKPSTKKDANDETEPSNAPNFEADDIEEGEID